MKKIDFSNVQEAKDNKRLVAGGYIAKITHVEDVLPKEYLLIEYDIASGEFAGYYKDLLDKMMFWGGKFYRSYKDTALTFFKSFLTAVEHSNNGFVWTSDEKALIGKYVGIVLGEEEYVKKDNTIGTRLYVAETRSVDKIKSGNFKTPDKKCLKANANKPFTASDFGVDVSELPFK
jgi:hypothetical protein